MSSAVENKTSELEQSLVKFSSQIMELRGELSVKEHVSAECGQPWGEFSNLSPERGNQGSELNYAFAPHFQALSEAGEKLRAADQDMSALRSEVNRLSAALSDLESQRKSWSGESEALQGELSELRAEVSHDSIKEPCFIYIYRPRS